MGLKERIEAIEAKSPDAIVTRYEAAQLAAESDALMAEMAEALRKASSRGNRFAAEYALHKYNQYKDKTND